MAMYKCKMCGGDLEITQELSVCECLYCGSQQTLPKLNDEKKRNLHDRAGHFRRNNEYDKAMALYEQILNEDTEDAESYWSLVLCRYGIEYVEDPVSHKRVPTVNRAQFTSVLADENYKAAIRYADEEQRSIYEAEAKEIDRLQKEILEISEKEKPFDVFICYKESDANGRRTQDSVLATDLYHQLTQEGFKVFFARITLEDKLGSAYEPYIFAALNSAKVMVVLGTKKEYFEAVWVKNEWSRFLALIKGGAKKVLIPAYRDMDPYDLPEEFSYLQAQDMSKLGFMQDLIRGIKKLTGEQERKSEKTSEKKGTAVSDSGNSVDALLKRAYMFLEDGEFGRADQFGEQVLNIDPENASAYVVKLMAERKARTQADLSEGVEELSENNYFKKAVRFAEEGLKGELERCNEIIVGRNKDEFYEETHAMVNGCAQGLFENTMQVLDEAIKRYESLLGWRDSEEKIVECRKQQETMEYQRKSQVYEQAVICVKENEKKRWKIKKRISAVERAEEMFHSLGDFRDSEEKLELCKKIKQQCQNELRKKKFRRVGVVLGGAMVIAIVIAFIIHDTMKWKAASFDYMEYAEMGFPAELVIKNNGRYKASEIELCDVFYVKSIVIETEGADFFESIYLECCDNLTEVIVPDNATSLKKIEIVDCTSIQNVVAPKGTEVVLVLEQSSEETSIEENAFSECRGVTDIVISSGVTSIGKYSFSGCYMLKNVELPSGLLNIGDCAFYDSQDLKRINIPHGVINIGRYAFARCHSLENIELPSSVTSVEEYAFHLCDGMESISISSGVTSIGMGVFSNCYRLKSVELPSGVTSIGERSFSYCKELTNIEFPEGLLSIGDYAFEGCSKLESIKIPSSVTSIGNRAFWECTGLTSVEIPSSVTSIELFAWPIECVLKVQKKSYAEEWAKKNGYKVEYYTP